MKKPSKIKCVSAKKAWLLFSGFVAITLFGVVYCKSQSRVDEINKSENIDSQLESHETIHVRQAESTKDSWLLYYLKYIWQWIINFPLIFVNTYAPYKFMPFELEAYANQDDWNYCLGKCENWKVYKKLTLKQKRQFAKDYYNCPIRPYFTIFIKDNINPVLGL
jgi:hypothetical protein